MLGIDLGTTTYSFLFLNCILLIIGLVRILVAVMLLLTSVFVFPHLKKVSFLSVIGDTFLIGLNEEATFILGILAGFKNNLRLMYTYEFILILLTVSKIVTLNGASTTTSLIEDDIRSSLEDLMTDNAMLTRYSSKVDDIQQYFNCCGYDGPAFWLKFRNNNTGIVEYSPQSCCFGYKTEKCDLQTNTKKGCLTNINANFPYTLLRIHKYLLFTIFEILLFIIGILMLIFIKRTLAHSLA